MATGSGKTTVMGMLAAWSILNKVNDRSDARFSDVVLIVCPNVTIKNRLRELDPEGGEASLYRSRDLVPAHLMPLLTQGRVLVTNWHVFEPQAIQTGGVGARVTKAGVEVRTKETITIGPDDDMENRRQDIMDACARADSGQGVVVCTDMFGGTPSNLAISCMNGRKIEVVAGINLPMLIKLASVRDEVGLTEAVAQAQDAGRKYISVASRVLAGK